MTRSKKMASSSSKKIYVLSTGENDLTVGERSRTTVGAGESLDVTIIVLPGVSAYIPLTIDLTGPGAEVSLKGIYISSGTDEVTFDILVNHRVGNCVSNQLFNGLASGSAKCSFF